MQPNTNRSAEAQPSNLVLSPETSTALENAEKIINNAKIQLMEVCATSSFDSVRRNRDTWVEKENWFLEIFYLIFYLEVTSSFFHDCDFSRRIICDIIYILIYRHHLKVSISKVTRWPQFKLCNKYQVLMMSNRISSKFSDR